MYLFFKNEDQEPCFKCSNIDDVIPVCNGIVLAMYINDQEGYVTCKDEHDRYVHMEVSDNVPNLFLS